MKHPDLVLEERFDFIAPYSLEECSRRLLNDADSIARSFRGLVEMERHSETSHAFQLRTQTNIGSGWIVGVLQRQDEATTLVSGVFGVGRGFVIWSVGFIPLICAASCVAIYQTTYIWLPVLAIVVPVVVWSNRSSARSRLFKFLDIIRGGNGEP